MTPPDSRTPIIVLDGPSDSLSIKAAEQETAIVAAATSPALSAVRARHAANLAAASKPDNTVVGQALARARAQVRARGVDPRIIDLYNAARSKAS